MIYNYTKIYMPNNHSSCTIRSSENICSSSGGAQEKKRKDRTKLSLPPKLMVFSVSYPPLEYYYYPSTLANSPLIILFSKMLKFSKNDFFQIKKIL
jgi:hypothetical protein